MRNLRALVRWGFENDPHGIAIAFIVPSLLVLAAFIGAIL